MKSFEIFTMGKPGSDHITYNAAEPHEIYGIYIFSKIYLQSIYLFHTSVIIQVMLSLYKNADASTLLNKGAFHPSAIGFFTHCPSYQNPTLSTTIEERNQSQTGKVRKGRWGLELKQGVALKLARRCL